MKIWKRAKVYAHFLMFEERHTTKTKIVPGEGFSGTEERTEYRVLEERIWVVVLRTLAVGVVIIVYLVGFYLILLWQRRR